jgi:cytochrome c oxidase cbb3-type subunit 3
MRIKLFVVCAIITISLTAVYGLDNPSGAARVQADGAATFKNRCVKCHGVDGKGKPDFTPDFTDAKWQAAHKDEELTQTITDGKGEMPAYDAILDKDQIAGLVKYIRSLAKAGNE